jgi:hypothetical protein
MPHTNKFHPSIETLEVRLAPAVTYRILDLNGNAMPDLQIIGNGKNQIIQIVDDPAANKTLLSIDGNGDGDFDDPGEIQDELLATGFDVYDVRLGGGKDTFEYTSTSDYVGTTRDLRIKLGNGEDTATLNMDSSVGTGTTFLANIDMGGGHDRFTGNFLINSFHVIGNLELNVHGGWGHDLITFTRTDPEDSDEPTVLGPSTITGFFALNIYGDVGHDRTMIDFGVANGLDLGGAGEIQLRSDGGHGNDSTLVTFRNTFTSSGLYDLQLMGDKGKDLLSFGVFDDSSGAVQYETGSVLLDGGKGKKDSGLLAPGQDAPTTKINLEN